MIRPIAGSLPAFLAEVPDPRDRAGRRHPLPAMLAHACCAILCGCRGYAAIAQWGRDQPIELMHHPGYTRNPPAYGTFQALFARLDAAAFEAAISRWIAHLADADADAAPALQAVALDGKVARGSGTAATAAVHLLAALDQRTGCVPAQARVPAGTNEHKAASALLRAMVLRGRVITGDAAFCQRDLCRTVLEGGGHYLIKVAANSAGIDGGYRGGHGASPPPPRRPARRRG